MSNEKIGIKDISVGQALPWAVCDDDGILLLRKGSIISSERQLHALVKRGLYKVEKGTGKTVTNAAKSIRDNASPFDKFYNLMDKVSNLFTAIILKQGNVQDQVYRLCNEIQELCDRNSDAALGAIHLCQVSPYPICHSLHVAVLSAVIAERYGCNASQSQSVIAASLTSNVSMLELQEILHHQQTPLTDEQHTQIHEHPLKSVEMLKQAGVDDDVWLRAVSQHHERTDGLGYPLELKKDDIRIESNITSIADRYAAMVSARSYREPMTSKEVLREFFLCKDKEFNETLILAFIKELSIFPPGSYVILKNGETAIVIKRGKGKMWPIVSSVLGSKHEPYARPLRRDSNEESYSIKDTCKLDKPLHIGLNMVWGF